MLNFHDIQPGDFLVADNEGRWDIGEVTGLNHDEKQVCLYNGVQDFWYDMNQLMPIPLDETYLERLKFSAEIQPDGTVKYKKGAFRLQIQKPGDFSAFEIWYRDEHRHIYHPIHVHELQNHFHEMTKVELTEEAY